MRLLRPFIIVIDLLLWVVQGIVMLALIVPLQRVSQAMNWLSWRIIKHAYYHGLVVTRRRITRRPLWSDTDIMLGIQPPPSELERLTKLASE